MGGFCGVRAGPAQGRAIECGDGLQMMAFVRRASCEHTAARGRLLKDGAARYMLAEACRRQPEESRGRSQPPHEQMTQTRNGRGWSRNFHVWPTSHEPHTASHTHTARECRRRSMLQGTCLQ
eukprot:586123-Prymnesium_polylepis.4